MAATVGSWIDQNARRIEQVLNNSLESTLPTLDDAWVNMVRSNKGVVPVSRLGRDYEIIRQFYGSYSGVVDMADAVGNFPLYGEATTNYGAKLMRQNSPSYNYPDPFSSMTAKPFWLKVGLKAQRANVPLSLSQLALEGTPANIGSVLGPVMEGVARNIAHTHCNYWYTSSGSSYQLTSIGATSGTLAQVEAGTATFQHDTTNDVIYFRPQNLAGFRVAGPGMHVDIYDSTGATRRNELSAARIRCVIEWYDPLRNICKLVTDNSTFDSAVSANDIIVHANFESTDPVPTGFAGYNDWMKTGASGSAAADRRLLGAGAVGTDDEGIVDVTRHPEFRSFTASVGGVLTEHYLRKVLARWDIAMGKPYGKEVDTLVASDGVWLAYEAQKIGMQQLDRTGRLSSLNSEGSEEGFTFRYNGRSYKGYTSSFLESGRLIGVKMGGGNWKMVSPPNRSGTTTFPSNGDTFAPIELPLAALSGSSKAPVWRTASGVSLATEYAQMPMDVRFQIVPDQPNGIILTGITEDRLYSS